MEQSEKDRAATTLFISRSLWRQVRIAAAQRNLKMWEVVDAGLRWWLKNGKAGA
jgi:hypothetical protein